MKTILSFHLIFLAMCFGLPFKEKKTDGPTAFLYALHESNHVKLLWEAKYWEKGLEGYEIMRRQKGKKWEKAHSGIFQLAVDSSDFNNVSQQPENIQEACKQGAKKFISGMSWTREQTIQELEKNPAMFGMFQSMLDLDYNTAMFVGFGFTDVIKGGKASDLEYGLFYKFKGKKTGKKPVATAVPAAMQPIKLENLTATGKAAGSIKLNWNYPKKAYHAGNKYFFVFENQSSKDGEAVRLQSMPHVCDDNKESEVINCEYTVIPKSPESAGYTVQLINAFGQEAAKQFVSLEPPKK